MYNGKRRLIYILSLFLLTLVSNSSFAMESTGVELAYVGREGDLPALGVLQGVAEANLQGEFLGQNYTLRNYDPGQLGAMTNPAPVAIIAAMGEEGLRILAKNNPGIPVFNITDGSDALRKKCVDNLFHIIPNQKMRDDALAQFHQKSPDVNAEAVGWHHDFKKYAAGQVNKRFTDSYGKPMDEAAWSGWMAVKIISDAVVRTASSDLSKIMQFLKHDLAIDGAKGTKMTFRPNGQLRQILLLIVDGKITEEAPVRGVADTSDLDSLGAIECVPCQ